MKNSISIITLGLALISLCSCKLFKSPTVTKIQDVKVVSITPDKSTIKISLMVSNPNCYKLKLDKLNVDLLNKNRANVGTASLQNVVEIPKKSALCLDFNVELETRPVVKMVSSLDQKVQFFITGKGYAKVLGIGKNFQFDEPYELDLKEQLKNIIPKFSTNGQSLFKIMKTTVEKIGFGETELHIHFLILNPYGLTFNFKGFPAEIYISDKSAGIGNLKNQLQFNENIFSQEGVMVFKLNNLKTILGAVKGAVKGEIKYVVKGKVLIAALGMEINQPYTYQDYLPVNILEMLLN
ncbi:MAG TPA: hypothetical protein PK617_00225 [Candidatus Cloacimonas sp.]|nr:hypothetical protein [Candidatus Cloacimonas sp.]